MLAVVGSRVCYRTIGHGEFHCERCGGDRPYRHRAGRRWASLLGLPVVRCGDTGEHLRCAICLTCYRVELLAVPTMAQMRLALLAATTTAVHAMLRAGGPIIPAAKRRAIALIRSAGSPDYGEANLSAALGTGPGQASGVPQQHGQVLGLRPALEAVAIQLEAHAREWFLAKIVHVGLASGSLSPAEREVAATIARYLGMTKAQARAVIALTEEAAQAG